MPTVMLVIPTLQLTTVSLSLDDKRQMSVEINTANIGIDPEERLGSYELIKTEHKMEPIDFLDPTLLPPQGYRVDNNIMGGDGYAGAASVSPTYEQQQPMNVMSNAAPLHNNNGNFHHKVKPSQSSCSTQSWISCADSVHEPRTTSISTTATSSKYHNPTSAKHWYSNSRTWSGRTISLRHAHGDHGIGRWHWRH